MKMERRTVEYEIARQARSCKEVATAAGVTEKTLRKARRGEEIQTATAGRIAAALGLRLEEIIERGNE